MRYNVRSEIKVSELAPALAEREHSIHDYALEWSLAEPIIIENSEDIKSKVNWQDRIQPFHHQIRNLMTFCRKLPVSLIADDVGLGKTISAGLILSELMVRNRVSRTLVICPSLLGPQWVEELESKFGIFARWSTGSNLDTELRSSCPVVVTTYQSASSRLERIQPGSFDMLILDEAHKVRNLYGQQKPPQFATRIRNALQERLFRYVVMLTATPIQNRLWDLYSLFECLAVAKGHANPFGTPEEFKRQYIRDSVVAARELNPAHAERFRGIVRQYMARTRRQDAKLLFPERQIRLFRVNPNTLDSRLQHLVARRIDEIEGVNALLRTSLLIAMMSSPHALVSQLTNMAEKHDKWRELAADVQRLIDQFPTPTKLEGVLRVIDQIKEQQAKEWRAVIFTTRTETQRLIVERLTAMGISCAVIRGGNPQANYSAVKRYSSSPPDANVIVSTDAGAEGVNLQAGNVVINYDLPWNPMIVEQRIGRVQRLASKHAHVVILNMAVAGGPEEWIIARLMAKLQTISHSVGDIEAILEASAHDSDTGTASFESMIRELVIKSLKGIDVTRATELAEKSIQEAKDVFESQRAELDSTLGPLNEIHDTGPSMPKLTTLQPTIPYQEFVRSALEEEGYQLRTNPDGLMIASKRGSPDETIVFTAREWERYSQPGVFHGKSARFYAPGKPAFERLVQRWLDRSQHFTIDLTSPDDGRIRDVCEHWLQGIEGSQYERAEVVDTEHFWQGRTVFKATATNAVDSYETLVEVAHSPDAHRVIDLSRVSPGNVVNETLQADQGHSDLANTAREAIQNNDDIAAFCAFYQSRLEEEIDKAGNHPDLVNRLQTDLNPILFGEPVSQFGFRYSTCLVRLHYSIDGNSGYASRLTISPATDQVFEAPQIDARCERTHKLVPRTCLERCARSGLRVLQHLLVTSDHSGRKALPEFTRTCEFTARTMLDDECKESDLSGRVALAGEFRMSPISKRLGLPDEFVACDFTGDAVLADEIIVSEVSGRKLRGDEMATCAVSGLSGHRSEFVVCEYSSESILAEHATKSDLSGSLVRSDYAVRSSRPPFRSARPDESVLCEQTGQLLLLDEVETCEVTSKTVDSELLGKSELSGRLALKELLVKCELTGEVLLPDETIVSCVSGRRVRRDLGRESAVSGKSAVADEFVRCEITGVTVLPDELATSQVSGRQFRQDEAVVSDISGTLAHRSECAVSELTGKLLLDSECGESHVSGRIVEKTSLQPSPISGQLALPEEFVCCEFTGVAVLPDELRRSDVSGRLFRCDEQAASEISGRIGHATEGTLCQHSNKAVLIDEVVHSVISGLRVASAFAIQSAVSQQWALLRESEVCEITGARVLPDELVTSAESGRRFRKDQIVKSPHSGRIGHQSESTVCQYTKRRVLVSEAGISDYTGKTTFAFELEESEKTGRRGVAAEFQRCAETGKNLLLDELAPSAVSGLLVDLDLLVPSGLSRKRALRHEMVNCGETGAYLLPEETVYCSDIDGPVNLRLAGVSAVSGKNGVMKNMVRCEVSGQLALRSELVRCELTGMNVIPSATDVCCASGKRALTSKMVRSGISQRWMLPSFAKKSARSGRILSPDESIFCFWDEQYLAPDETAQCQRTGLTFSDNHISKRTREFRILRAVLYNEVERENLASMIPWLRRQCDGKFKSVEYLFGVRSPKGNYIAAHANLHRFLGLVQSDAVFLISLKPQPKVIGKVTTPTDKAPGWADF